MTREGCAIAELSNIADDGEVSIARARLAAGQTTRWHRLRGTRERYVILQGSGSVELGQENPRPVTSGDIVLIPDGCPQRITVVGEEDLVFLAVCSPGFRWDSYESLD